jgi:Fe2+ or Zn2+ uptake regulation protein
MEVPFDTDAHLSAEDLAAAVLARASKDELGFTIDAHHFAILGRCPTCS